MILAFFINSIFLIVYKSNLGYDGCFNLLKSGQVLDTARFLD